MEEWIGQWWHRAISRAASREHAAAAVALAEVQPLLGALFRAGGGDGDTRLAPADARRVAAGRGARGWLQRVAGSGTRATLARREPSVLALPPQLAVFADRALNRELYLWLAALASCHVGGGDWISDNLRATAAALQRFPGLRERHARLVAAHLAQRPAADSQPAEARVQAALRRSVAEGPADAAISARDRAVQAPLQDAMEQAAVELTPAAPADLASDPVQPHQVAPVWLWLDDAPAAPADARAAAAGRDAPPNDAAERPADADASAADITRHKARRVQDERGRAPLLMPFRAESLHIAGEWQRLDRGGDDTPDDAASTAAHDLDQLDLAADGSGLAARVKFDLDLPSAAADDLPLGPGVPLPEWDFRRQRLQPAHCTAQLRVARAPATGPGAGTGPSPGAEPAWQPPPALRATANRLRRRLEAQQAAPRWLRGQPQGERIDLDAWVRHGSQRGISAAQTGSPPVYQDRRRAERQLATLLLADLSLSTDAWIKGDAARGQPDRRVIDVVREALFVFGHALSAGGDAFGMLGFSSVRRHQVRMQHLKGFDEPWGAPVLQRLGALKPGYYTRMGAAIRYATQQLSQRGERQRLLLLLTDGKPNDLDNYEGRYGLEDTRHAVQAAREVGLVPFCVTIDQQAAAYLPALFGVRGHALVRRPAELATRLAQLHSQLVR